MRRLSVLAALLMLSGCSSNCPGSEAARIKATSIPTYDPKTGKLTRLTADLDKNGTIDTWTYMDGTNILRTERDRNEDGKVDFWEFNLPDGKGLIDRTEEDTNGDGIPDKWDRFREGAIFQSEWDDNHDGARDRRWTYGAGGAVVSIETRPDGRGGYLDKK